MRKKIDFNAFKATVATLQPPVYWMKQTPSDITYAEVTREEVLAFFEEAPQDIVECRVFNPMEELTVRAGGTYYRLTHLPNQSRSVPYRTVRQFVYTDAGCQSLKVRTYLKAGDTYLSLYEMEKSHA